MQIGVSFALTRLKNGTGSGGDVTPAPMRFVSVQNRAPQLEQAMTGFDRILCYWPHVLGTDVTEIYIGAQGWSKDLTEAADTNNWGYQSMSVSTGSEFAPVNWSGVRTLTVVSGFNNYISDAVTAADLGFVDYIPRGTQIWVKAIVTLPNASSSMPHNTNLAAGDVTNAQYRPYLAADTTPSTTDATGVYTWTGTNPGFVFGAHAPYMLGIPVTDTLVYMCIGDSIAAGFGDGEDQDEYGKGFVQRAMHSGTFTNPVPCVNFAVSGVGTAGFLTTNNHWEYWAQFANRGIEELGVNNINSGNSLATIQAALTSLWGRITATLGPLNGTTKILRTRITPVTSSSDSWATTDNQTVGANYGPSAVGGQLSAWFLTQVGGAINAVSDLPSVRDTVDTYKFTANGVANFMTQDGTHLFDNSGNTAKGNEFAGNDLRTDRITMN